MTITRIQTASAHPTNSGSGALAYPSAVTTGSLLAAVVSCEQSGSQRTATVADSINGAWTKAASALYSTSGWLGEIGIFLFPNASAGSTTVTATYNGTATASICLAEYGGMPTTAALDGTPVSSANTVGTSHTTPSLTTANTDLLLAAMGDWGDNVAYSGFGGGFSLGVGFFPSGSNQSMLLDQGVGGSGVSAGTYAATAVSGASTSTTQILLAVQVSSGTPPTGSPAAFRFTAQYGTFF